MCRRREEEAAAAKKKEEEEEMKRAAQRKKDGLAVRDKIREARGWTALEIDAFVCATHLAKTRQAQKRASGSGYFTSLRTP